MINVAKSLRGGSSSFFLLASIFLRSQFNAFARIAGDSARSSSNLPSLAKVYKRGQTSRKQRS
jgi:hypothetical protein